MAVQEGGRPGVVESEVSRVRLRLLEAVWTGAGLAPRERRARLDTLLQESVAHLEPVTRNRVVEQVLDELGRWSAPQEPAGPVIQGGGDLTRALRASLEGGTTPDVVLSPEEQWLLDCVQVMLEHLQMASKNYIEFDKKIARKQTIIQPVPVKEELREAVRHASTGDWTGRLDGIKDLLHRMELTRNIFYLAARAAAAQALKKVIQDLNPERAGGSGKGGAKRGWEELERTYEMLDALLPEALCDKYFSEIYKNEIDQRAKG